MEVEIIVVRDGETAAAAAADLLAEVARAGGAMALSGGSTPRRAYVLAAEREPDWSRAHVWLGDERCVPLDDERSNARLVHDTLLATVERAPHLHLVHTELPPDAAAAGYDDELTDVTLDLALQGIGSDGHTASLFPNAPSLAAGDRRSVTAEAGLEPWVPRVTMTLGFLAGAGHVVFLAVGADKAEPVRRALTDPPTAAIPASLLRSRTGRTTAILDEAAAALLP
jgi:6-phosphogluconolactonase